VVDSFFEDRKNVKVLPRSRERGNLHRTGTRVRYLISLVGGTYIETYSCH